jgi:uncharacterized protein with PIN domain
MQVSQSRFSLTPTEQARLSTYEKHVWHNSEVCNHCFTKVREVERNPVAARLGPTSLRNVPAEYHERTDDGTQEFCGWDNNPRFGTCFCLECGGDLSASHRDISLERMKTYAVNLEQYVRDHTPLALNRERFARELIRQKRRDGTQGCESQIFAVAFIRGLDTGHQTGHPARAD